MYKKWVITGLCIYLSVMGITIADETILADEQCSLATATNDLDILSDLQPWFTHEQHQSLHAYQQRITRLESQTGAYGEQLAPALINLGLLQQEAGNHHEASKVFLRALYIIRINDGLESPKQLPLLELLIKANSAIDAWREVANNHDLMYWLYKRNYHINDPRLLPVIKRLRRWHIEAYNKDTGRSLSEHFNAADKLYAQAINIIKKCTGGQQQALCFWNKSCCADAPAEDGPCPIDLASHK